MEVSKYLHPTGNKNVEVITDYLSEEELVDLFRSVDCYVSPHRSEGFGLFILQAMAAGCPVIATGFSGNLDYCLSEEFGKGKPIVELIKTDGNYVPQNSMIYMNSTWKNPDKKHLSELMKQIEKGKYKFDTEAVSKHIRKNYSIQKIVDKMMKEVGKF